MKYLVKAVVYFDDTDGVSANILYRFIEGIILKQGVSLNSERSFVEKGVLYEDGGKELKILARTEKAGEL